MGKHRAQEIVLNTKTSMSLKEEVTDSRLYLLNWRWDERNPPLGALCRAMGMNEMGTRMIRRSQRQETELCPESETGRRGLQQREATNWHCLRGEAESPSCALGHPDRESN